MNMTESQRLSMIEFHHKMEKAYLKYGRPDQAEAARKQREKLEGMR